MVISRSWLRKKFDSKPREKLQVLCNIVFIQEFKIVLVCSITVAKVHFIKEKEYFLNYIYLILDLTGTYVATGPQDYDFRRQNTLLPKIRKSKSTRIWLYCAEIFEVRQKFCCATILTIISLFITCQNHTLKNPATCISYTENFVHLIFLRKPLGLSF